MSEKLVFLEPPEWDYDINRIVTFSIDTKLLRDPSYIFIFEKLFSLGMIPLSIQNNDFGSRAVKYVCAHKYFPRIPEGAMIPEYDIIVQGEERTLNVNNPIKSVSKISLRPKGGGPDIIAYHSEIA
jgi:hypothetical protein